MVRARARCRRAAVRPWCAGLLVLASCALAACSTSEGSDESRRSTTTTAEASSTSTTTPEPINYQVQPGDTLTKIAAFFGVSTQFLAQANNLGNADSLTVGQILQIPHRPPVALTVTPDTGEPGDSFDLELVGAEEGELVTFEITAPNGESFTGPPHVAPSGDSVTARYGSDVSAAPGRYEVVARGDRGADASASFRLKRAPAP